MIEPKVSICVPVYGVEACIERCAISLFEQSYNNIEYVFVNDCTLDSSINILHSVLQKYPHRIEQTKIISHNINKGSAGTRNTLLDNVTGEFIIWVDSDDYIEKILVAEVIKKQQEANADVVFYGYASHKGKLVHTVLPKDLGSGEWAYNALARHISVVLWDKCVRTDIYKNNKLHFIEGLNMGEDYYIVPQVLYHAKNVVVLKKSLYHYSIAAVTDSYCNSFSEAKWRQMIQVLDKLNDIFEKKDTKYKIAYKIAQSRLIALNLISVCGVPEKHKEYYKYLRNRANKIERNYWIYANKKYRIAFWIKSHILLRLYVRTIKSIQHFFVS